LNNNNRGGSNGSNNNNRRRGRTNRPGGGNGGQQLNRVDSRARGNAPQMLEKYRKLAHDAHLNGDRVQAEYYLQFADHYFRVTADTRVRQEEGRTRAPGERWPEGDEGDDAGDFTSNSDFPSFDQPSYNRPPRDDRPREERAPRPVRQAQDDRDAPREDRPNDERPREDRPREDRPRRDDNRAARAPRPAPAEPEAVAEDVVADANPYEPPENPFVQEGRSRQGLRPRRESRPRRDEGDNAPVGLDPASLPPAISASRSDPVDDVADEAEAKPRKRAPRRKPSAGETLEPVN
jgi:hypothetical protein